MAVLGIDLGATKVALALFSEKGEIIQKQTALLQHRNGQEVGELILSSARDLISKKKSIFIISDIKCQCR